MKIGLTQMDIIWEDKEKNKEQCLLYIQRAKEQGVDLLVFPEMTLTGFSVNAPYISENEPENTRGFFKNASLKYGMAICYGYAKESNGTYKNKCELVSEGALLSEYEKIHPFTYGEEGKFFAGGNSLSVASLRLGHEEWSIGSTICYDLRFPELFQAISERAHLITVIANWPKERVMHWDALLRARAIENQCYICGVNRVGRGGGLNYVHSSALYDSLGNVIASGRDELLTAIITPEAVIRTREDFPLKKDRRNELYAGWYKNMRD